MKLPRDFYPSVAAALLVMLGLGLIYLLVMERITPLAALGVLTVVVVAMVIATGAGREEG